MLFNGRNEDVVLKEHVERSDRRRTGEGIAAEGRAVRSRGKGLGGLVRGQEGADGHARAEPFGECCNIGSDTGMLIGEEFSGPAHAGLYFIEHEQQVVPVADIPQGLQIPRCRVHSRRPRPGSVRRARRRYAR